MDGRPARHKQSALRREKLGESWIADISTRGIGLFPAPRLKQGRGQKAVNDIFTVVRHIGAYAFGDRTLRSALEQADPFSREEIEGIDKVDPARIPDARMSMLNGWTELWLSDVIALVVEDVERRTVQARRPPVVRE